MATATKVSTGKPKVGGAVFRAPVGTTLPTDAATTLNVAFKEMGYISDEGLTNANTVTSNSVKDWGGVVVMTIQDEKKDQFKFTPIESLNVEVLKAVYGDTNVTEDATNHTITVHATAAEAIEYSWVFDLVMRGGALKRIVLPNAKISELGDIVYNSADPVGYPITLDAFPDAAEKTHYEYIKLPTT